MNSKFFEYSSKDKPFLKKDIGMRIVFMSLFSLVFLWQFISIIVCAVRRTLTNLNLFVGLFACIIMLSFILVCLLYMNKSLVAMKEIKNQGRSVNSVKLLVKSDKNSFIKLYSILSIVLALVMLFVAVCGITYLILQLIYLKTYSFYLPILFFITVCGFNSVYHIRYEITTMKEVEKYNSRY